MDAIVSTIQRWIAQIFVYTLTAKASAIGDDDAVESADGASDNAGGSKTQRATVRIQPFGFNSLPPNGLRGLSLRLGMSNIFFIGIGPQKSYGPTNMEQGETALYAKQGQTVLLDKDGNIVATPKSGQTVQLGGNTYSLPKWDDFATQLDTFINAIAGLTPNPPTTLVQALAYLATIITAANALKTAMAANSDYKSSIAKNG